MVIFEVVCGLPECANIANIDLGDDLGGARCPLHTPPTPCPGHKWIDITGLSERPYRMLCQDCSEVQWFPTRMAAERSSLESEMLARQHEF